MEPQMRLVKIEVPVPLGGKPMSTSNMTNVPLSAKFMAVAEELVMREHQERQLKQENSRLQGKLIHVLGPRLERLLERMARTSLREVFNGWHQIKEFLSLERRAEDLEDLRRREEKEHKSAAKRFEEELMTSHLMIQDLQTQLNQCRQGEHQAREEVAALSSANERLVAQLAQAERCITNMRRDADLKAETARHDVKEYTARSRNLLRELEQRSTHSNPNLVSPQRRTPGEGSHGQ